MRGYCCCYCCCPPECLTTSYPTAAPHLSISASQHLNTSILKTPNSPNYLSLLQHIYSPRHYPTIWRVFFLTISLRGYTRHGNIAVTQSICFFRPPLCCPTCRCGVTMWPKTPVVSWITFFSTETLPAKAARGSILPGPCISTWQVRAGI